MKIVNAALLAGLLSMVAVPALAADAKPHTVAAVHQNKAALSGQPVSVQGKVVKVNNGIMRRNFVHVQDGTGDAGSNTLIVTSAQTANVGDKVSVSGTVFLNRDFGGGYMYPLLLENATITLK